MVFFVLHRCYYLQTQIFFISPICRIFLLGTSYVKNVSMFNICHCNFLYFYKIYYTSSIHVIFSKAVRLCCFPIPLDEFYNIRGGEDHIRYNLNWFALFTSFVQFLLSYIVFYIGMRVGTPGYAEWSSPQIFSLCLPAPSPQTITLQGPGGEEREVLCLVIQHCSCSNTDCKLTGVHQCSWNSPNLPEPDTWITHTDSKALCQTCVTKLKGRGGVCVTCFSNIYMLLRRPATFKRSQKRVFEEKKHFYVCAPFRPI